MRPKICYIHGLNQTRHSFNYISQEMQHNGDVLIDYDSHQALERSIVQVLRFIPKTEPVILVGHSLGGLIAMLIAGRKLVEVERVITMSSPLGGSRAAVFARWVATGIPLLNDLVPNSTQVKEIASTKLDVPVLNVISTSGSLPTSSEPNDGVVTLSSQRAYKHGKKVDVKANHFEVLLHDKTIDHLTKFING